MTALSDLWLAYKMRWRRRKYLLRAFRRRHELYSISNRTKQIRHDDILVFATMRNEIARLPYYLDHYRKMGVSHFLIVENNSDDATQSYLASQPDVSVWTTTASYKASRFGVDWLNWLQNSYGRGHWCLTVDADEILVLPHDDARNLNDLTTWLDQRGRPFFAATMLDMYPDTPLSVAKYTPGTPPQTSIPWFDPWGYTWEWQAKHSNISIRGGVRKRLFFQENPDHAPHMHKTPLIRWKRGFVYASSTHLALPRYLNRGYDARLNAPTGVLLHSKFLNVVVEKSTEELSRREHFTYTERYDDYYKSLIDDPVLWDENSVRFTNWEQLEDLGLMTRGDWI